MKKIAGICILDTNAFINFGSAYIGTKRILDVLCDMFTQVLISLDILNEIKKIVTHKKIPNYEEINKLCNLEVFMRKRIKVERAPDVCLDSMRKEETKYSIDLTIKKYLGSGERSAAGLALYLGREHSEWSVFLISSDFKALKLLRPIFENQHLGDVFSPLDFVIFSRAKGVILPNEARRSLKELAETIYTDPKQKSEIQKDYLGRLRKLCLHACSDRKCGLR